MFPIRRLTPIRTTRIVGPWLAWVLPLVFLRGDGFGPGGGPRIILNTQDHTGGGFSRSAAAPRKDLSDPASLLDAYPGGAEPAHGDSADGESSLSLFDPVPLGIDEYGATVEVGLMYRNVLLGGEPGAGKSVALNTIVAHAALCPETQLWLADGKQVELGLWQPIATRFVTDNMAHVLRLLRHLRRELVARYSFLRARRQRKITPEHLSTFPPILLAIDELALYTSTLGEAKQQDEFSTLLRDIVARGRAAGIVVVAATQRPSHDIIPTSLRDLFAYRLAFRCSTPQASDTILGAGRAAQGYSAADIDPQTPGVGFLLAEGGQPQRIRTDSLSDDDIDQIVRDAALLRGLCHPGNDPDSPGGYRLIHPPEPRETDLNEDAA